MACSRLLIGTLAHTKPRAWLRSFVTRSCFSHQVDSWNCTTVDALHPVFSCLFTMLRSRHVFPKAPCISVLRLRNHTLFFIPLWSFTVCRILSVGRLPFVTLFFNVLFPEISFSCQKNFDHNRFHLPHSVFPCNRDFASLTNSTPYN